VFARYSFVHALDSTGADWYASRGTWTTSNPAVVSLADTTAITTGDTGWAVIRVKVTGRSDSMLVHVRRVSFASVSAGYPGATCRVPRIDLAAAISSGSREVIEHAAAHERKYWVRLVARFRNGDFCAGLVDALVQPLDQIRREEGRVARH